MTIPEVLLCAIFLALALAAIAGFHHNFVTQEKVADTRRLLALLDRGMRVFEQKTGALPDVNAIEASPVVEVLLTEREVMDVLDDASVFLLYREDEGVECRDAWGTPIRYIPAAAATPALARRIRLAGGRPIFESAGPDRDFGDAEPQRASDNIASDEPTAGL